MEYKSLRKMMWEFLVSQKKKIIVSVSVVSLIVSNSCWFSSFMSYLKLYFSAFPFHLLGHGLNKNCAFLVCNGLLVFVAKTSGSFLSPGSGFDLDEMLDNKIGYGNLQTTLETKEPKPLLIKYKEEDEVVVTEVEGKNGGGNEVNEAAETEGEEVEEQNKTTNSVMEDLPGDGRQGGGEGDGKKKIDGSENENELEVGLFSGGEEEQQDQEEEEEEEEEEKEECMERLSAEELNKKFEEFIRKMKEEIRKGSSADCSHVNYNYDINLYDKNWPIMIVN